MLDNAQLQQLIIESAIKLFAFGEGEMPSVEQMNEYFGMLQITDGDFDKRIEKIFMLVFEHIRNHDLEIDVEKMKQLFSLAVKVNEDGADKVIEDCANFLMVYGVEFNRKDLTINEKVAMLENVNYKNFGMRSEIKKMYLYSYLDLLLVQPDLNYAKIAEISNNLKEFLN